MRINCYGERTESATYDKNLPVRPLESKTVGGTTYLRLGDGERGPIHRLAVGADGIVVREWACGKWDEAESLAYVPTTQTMEVDA